MAKTLELQVRMGGRWYDGAVLNNALETLAKGKPLVRAGTWLMIAAAIDEAVPETPAAAGGARVPVTLTDGQARRLWAEIVKLPVEAFGRSPAGAPTPVPLGPLVAFLRELAGACGEELPGAWSDDEEDE